MSTSVKPSSPPSSTSTGFSSFSRPLRMAERLRDHLLLEIQQQRWSESLPSERQLSSQLHVSRPTLRAALHSLAAEGILEPRRGQPYRIVHASVGTPSTRSRAAEMVFLYNSRARPNMALTAPFVAELQHRLHPHGFGVTMLNAMQAGAKGLNRALSRIDEEFFPAYYLLASVPAAVHEWFEKRGLNCIIIGSRHPSIRIPAVEVDQETTVQHAVSYLARRNHRNISLLQTPIATVGDELTAEAFQKTCLQFKAQGVRGLIHTSAARPAIVEGSVRRLMAGAHRPSAIVVTDIELALGLYTTLAQLGLSIPRHVSVIAICHSPSFDFVRPFPTCYTFSWETLADRITKVIENHCRLGTWPTSQWKVFPKLREGGSVATL